MKNYNIFGLKDPKYNSAPCLISFNKEANKDLIEQLEQNKEKKDNTTNYGDIVYNMMNPNNNEITDKNEQANLHK